jgi:hypothetical protein
MQKYKSGTKVITPSANYLIITKKRMLELTKIGLPVVTLNNGQYAVVTK